MVNRRACFALILFIAGLANVGCGRNAPPTRFLLPLVPKPLTWRSELTASITSS